MAIHLTISHQIFVFFVWIIAHRWKYMSLHRILRAHTCPQLSAHTYPKRSFSLLMLKFKQISNKNTKIFSQMKSLYNILNKLKKNVMCIT